ncbi:DUF1707 domain-containing protein [Nocardia sp. NPDC057663]|uniref:DUF1707 domain-containing protein n=1 Tax=Nocardia sp. NPDC057663 TaxID=3346201 RepID=UPI00366B97AB
MTRARDIDRAQVSTVLDAAYAEGQLGAQEYHDRMDRAGTARTLGELERLTADLQSPAVFGGQPPAERKRFGRKHSGEYPARTRARDADRARTTAALDAARADGQLDAEEHAAFTESADKDALAAALATAVATVRVPGGKVAHVSIENDHWLRQPAIGISVTNEATQSGRLYLALSGEVLKTSPFEG